MTKLVELQQGTLEILILKAVSLGPLHGYGILLHIQQISGEPLEILQGSFYTAGLSSGAARQESSRIQKRSSLCPDC